MKCFIGFDPRQPVAFQVCAQSVWEHASKPVEIVRLDLRNLPITRRGLTEFTYSRFLVPYLSGFDGVSLFLDSDILVRADITQLIPQRHVNIVKHERAFERPSVMLFSNYYLDHLTPEYVDNPSNKMFDWKWVHPEDIGELPKEWNHLVGYDAPNPDAKIVHFTMGIPIWKETAGCEFSEEWRDTFRRMNSSVGFNELMGRSVHVPHIKNLTISNRDQALSRMTEEQKRQMFG